MCACQGLCSRERDVWSSIGLRDDLPGLYCSGSERASARVRVCVCNTHTCTRTHTHTDTKKHLPRHMHEEPSVGASEAGEERRTGL